MADDIGKGENEVREPKREEADECAKLIYISGSHLFSYLYCEKEPQIYDLFEYFFKSPETTFSRDSILVDEKDGAVRGMVITHPVPNLGKLLFNEIRCIIEMQGGLLKSFFHLLKMISRFPLAMHYPRLKKDEYYIASIAVFEEYRGKGISTRLLKEVESRALEMGFRRLSLFVEIDNEHAKKVYEKYGFKEEGRSVLPKRYNKYGLHGFYKMVKIL